jgi:chromosome segregation ATPase
MSIPTTFVPVSIAAGSAGAEFVGALPPWLAAGVTIGGCFGWLRYVWLPKAEKRLRNAQATAQELGGDRISVDTAEEVVRFARGEFELIKNELKEARESYRKERVRADDAHQKLIEVQASLAGAQANLAEAVTRASTDRANLGRQVHSLEEQVHLEQQRCARLGEELDTVKAQIGAKERRAPTPRRATDEPSRPRAAH